MGWTKGIAALAVAVSLLVGIAPMTPPAKADVDVSFGLFYGDLSPHGSWYVSAQYGRVWQPRVYNSGWNPYYDGHWEYTDFGWTWVSDYSWGSVPYHYGTWVLDARYGWVWVPGYTWAPSWVVFRTGPDYYGWAPVPVGWSFGASVSVDPSFFVFVNSRDFLAPRIRVAALPMSRTTVIVNKTKIINNINIQNNVVVNNGPDVRTVERVSGRRIERKPIERVARVAPFERVSKERLQVSPDQARSRKVKAAEPESADRPLPDRRSETRQQPPSKTQQERQQPPSRTEAQQQQPQQQREADQAKARADARARTEQRAEADRKAAQQKRDADQQAKARAEADRKAAEQQSRSQAQANTSARQKTERPPQDQQAAKARADQQRAQAEQKARADAQAKAKAQADAKKKADAAKKKKQQEEQPKKDEPNNDKER